MTQEQILVTGATGQVGRELCHLLKDKGLPYRALSRASGLDFNDPNTFARALAGGGRLFLVFPILDEKNMALFMEEAKRTHISQIVIMSGMSAERNKERYLGRLEILVEESGIPFVALRANWFFQNFTSFFKPMIEQGTIALPDGQAPISFIDTRDIAEVALYYLTHPIVPSHADTLTGPESLTHAQVAALFSKHLHPVAYQELTEQQAQEDLGFDELMLALYSGVRAHHTAPVTPDVEAILEKPARTLEDYILENKTTWQKTKSTL